MRFLVVLLLFLGTITQLYSQEDYSSEGDYTEEELKDFVLSDADTLNKAILYLKKKYLDPELIKSEKMFVAALNYIERSIPEIMISTNDKGTEVEVKIEDAVQKFSFQPSETIWQMALNLRDVFLFIEKHIKKKKTLKNVELSSVDGILSTLDPHTNLLRPSLYTEMQMSNSGSFGGLGIVISMRDGQLTVVNPIEDSPAYLAGIRSKDVIARINDESTVGMELSQAVDRMRGEAGTEITIHIMRKGWKEAKPFKLKRAIIKMKSITSKLLDGNIAYVKIRGFQGNTFTDLVSHMDALKQRSKNELRGIILDLRNDPGGLLDQAIRISDYFLKKGYIVSTVGVGNSYREDKEAYDDGVEPEYPIIVLTNSGSASASEIVSGALKTNKRALLLGQRTFGKGSVQTIFEFEDRSALKITIAQYLIAYNISIQGVGIEPDLAITPVILTKDEISYYDSSLYYHESDYETHLSESYNETLKGSSIFSLRYLFEDNRSEEEKKEELLFRDDTKFKNDFEIELAKKLLLNAKSSSSEELFKEIEPTLKKIKDEEDEKITKKLAQFKVDWAKGEENKSPKFDVKFETKEVIAGEKLKITAKVTNTGDETLYRLRGTTESEIYFLRGIEFLFGKIEPGKTSSWNAEIAIPKSANTQTSNLDLKFFLDEKELNITDRTFVKIKELSAPDYELSYSVVDQNKNGIIEPNENISLKVSIKNSGSGVGGETSFAIKNKTSKDLFIKKGRFVLEKQRFKPNFVAKESFDFYIKNEIKSGKIEMDLIIFDSDLRTFKKFDIEIPTNQKVENVVKKPIAIDFDKSTPQKIGKGENSKISLTGVVKGDIQDYYIYTSTFKKLQVDFDKIYFKSLKNNKKEDKFTVDVDLKPGLNRITLVARTSETLFSSKEILIFNEN
ncbi:PDZ domain-containing protein [bacterium]|nr:PDZ domain-containing protein [bacterium]